MKLIKDQDRRFSLPYLKVDQEMEINQKEKLKLRAHQVIQQKTKVRMGKPVQVITIQNLMRKKKMKMKARKERCMGKMRILMKTTRMMRDLNNLIMRNSWYIGN